MSTGCFDRNVRYLTWALASGCLLLLLGVSTQAAESISYNRDIRPVLSDNCFHCHGPDQKKRKGKFRLDEREDAVAKQAIVPGKPEESKLIERIFSTNADDVMPPPDAHKTLTANQKELLKRWIVAGAKYEKHWAYVLPVKPVTPSLRNPIDELIQEHLQQVGLNPSAPADRRTLIRRLYFDLVGLPPKPEEVDAFLQEQSPKAVAELVERLLSAPQYGERMAIGWLDVVRFADTIGYHSDNPRNIWPYRDYVIKAFNQNKRFDQFTREQLAGDLLPSPTLEQKVGSGFNRLLLSTEEGGAQPKDYEARMLTDRVRAVSTVWLGQTIGCAQCHDHKFDPITQRDFYSLGAFFADIEEPIIGSREPGMLVPNEEQEMRLKVLREQLQAAQLAYNAERPEWRSAYSQWQFKQGAALKQERCWTALSPAMLLSEGGSDLKLEKDHSVLVSGKRTATDTYTVSFTNQFQSARSLRLVALPHDSLPAKGPGRADNGDFVLAQVRCKLQRQGMEPRQIEFTSARVDFQGSTAALDLKLLAGSSADGEGKGWSVFPQVNQPHQLILSFAEPVDVLEGDQLLLELQSHASNALGHFRVDFTTNPEAYAGPLEFPPPKEIAEIIETPVEQRDSAQKEKLLAHFKSVAEETAEARNQLAEARKAVDAFEATVPRCLVSTTNTQPRTVRILPRGNFLIETGDIMRPALPAYLVPKEKGQEQRRLNRLDLANWLVCTENPLTARVVMNRMWKQFFGLGLSRVVDDLGAQGELPPNQALLDWLACEFMDSGWDMKHMVRLIVTSAAYQQTSIPSKELRARDPFNRELAVQSRWRLDAELVRDNTLSIAGLLVQQIGGPSFKPYQPDGYWENLNFPVRSYEATAGPDQYRRGLYVWWQRSYLHPSLLAFDAPTREECAAERNRSNIPQQAFVLLNDPIYVEAARALASRILTEGGRDTVSRVTWAWRQALSRPPRADELETVEALLAKELAEYRATPEAAGALLKIGQLTVPEKTDRVELAAWTNVARVLLNLHETITRS